jgi:hypothetical protein
MPNDREPHQAGKTAIDRDEAEQRLREAAEKRRTAQKQSTPEAEPEDSTEGEGSPGLTIMGGGGHA